MYLLTLGTLELTLHQKDLSKSMRMERNTAKQLLNGFGTIFNIFTVLLDKPKTKTDAENLSSDWKRIGSDMCKAIGRYEAERQKP